MKRIALAAAVLLVATVAPTALGAGPEVVVADLEGAPISAEAIPDYYCHDREFPLVHCFKTPAKLRTALVAGSRNMTALAAGDYVVVYSSPTYAGSYFYVSQDYDALAIVGWNDRIRSYRALNSGQGTFWTDWLETGTAQSFCCNHTVPVLSSTFDRQFSSVYRR